LNAEFWPDRLLLEPDADGVDHLVVDYTDYEDVYWDDYSPGWHWEFYVLRTNVERWERLESGNDVASDYSPIAEYEREAEGRPRTPPRLVPATPPPPPQHALHIWSPRPSASQPAPEQQPEDKAGPTEAVDHSSTEQSPPEPLTSKEWLKLEIERREKRGDIPKEITEFSVQIHGEMEKAVRAGIVKGVIEPRTIETHLRNETDLFVRKKRSPKS
jgi:hypothetical protein